MLNFSCSCCLFIGKALSFIIFLFLGIIKPAAPNGGYGAAGLKFIYSNLELESRS